MNPQNSSDVHSSISNLTEIELASLLSTSLRNNLKVIVPRYKVILYWTPACLQE